MKMVKCVNCKKEIEGLASWCSLKCEVEYCEKNNLRTGTQIKNKVFEDFKIINPHIKLKEVSQ